MAMIRRLERSSANLSGSAPLSRDATLPSLVRSDWQSAHYAGVLGEILARIHRIPRPALVRLTAHLIDHLDKSDADPDTEEDDPDHEHDGREPDEYL
jgi:hypothetical protein